MNSMLLKTLAVLSVGAALISAATITVHFPMYSGRISPYSQVQLDRYSALDSVLQWGFARPQAQTDTVSCSVFEGFGWGVPYRGIRVSLGEASMQAWNGYLKIGNRCYVDSDKVFEKALVQAALKGTFYVDGAPGSPDSVACGVGAELRGDVPCSRPTGLHNGGPRVPGASNGAARRAVRPDGRDLGAEAGRFHLEAPHRPQAAD